MRERIRVAVCGSDSITSSGIKAELAQRPELEVVCEPGQANVAVVATDHLDDEAIGTVKRLRRGEHARVIVLVTSFDDATLFAAIEAGASGLLRRCEVTTDVLAGAVRSAATGEGTLPPDLLGRLIDRVGDLQRQVLEPRGITFSGLAERELEVLRLAAEGLATTEIADRLAYSERTIKNIVRDITVRLGLRNRTQAVAYALRQGLI